MRRLTGPSSGLWSPDPCRLVGPEAVSGPFTARVVHAKPGTSTEQCCCGRLAPRPNRRSVIDAMTGGVPRPCVTPQLSSQRVNCRPVDGVVDEVAGPGIELQTAPGCAGPETTDAGGQHAERAAVARRRDPVACAT